MNARTHTTVAKEGSVRISRWHRQIFRRVLKDSGDRDVLIVERNTNVFRAVNDRWLTRKDGNVCEPDGIRSFPLHDESAPPAQRRRNRMKICVCCGGRMNACSPRNPNICLDCEALTLDDSPLLLASQTDECAPWESARDGLNESVPGQAVPAGYPTILSSQIAEEANSGLKKCR